MRPSPGDRGCTHAVLRPVMLFYLAVGAISLVIAAVQLLAAFDVLQVPDGPASPFVRNTNPRWVKVAMAGIIVFIGSGMILLAVLA